MKYINGYQLRYIADNIFERLILGDYDCDVYTLALVCNFFCDFSEKLIALK